MDTNEMTIARLRAQVAAGREVMVRGVALMPIDQLAQWAGVWAWLEQDESDYAPAEGDEVPA